MKLSMACLCATLAYAISGCSNEPPPPPPKPAAAPTANIMAPQVVTGVTVEVISLGTAIGADKKAAEFGESFEPVYAVGPTVSSFPLSKPTSWPLGNYHVEVFLDDKPAGIKNFSVK